MNALLKGKNSDCGGLLMRVLLIAMGSVAGTCQKNFSKQRRGMKS